MTFSPLNTNASLVVPPLAVPNSPSIFNWAKSAGGSRANETATDIDSGNAIAVDSVGNTYITGKLQGSNIPFGSTSVSTQDLSPDAFVTKLDASGNFLWTKTFGGLNPSAASVSLDVGQGITVDAQGNVFVIGSFQGTMQLGTSLSLASNGVSDVFVLKLNGADGSVTWGKSFGGAGIEQGFAIALDSTNNAYIAGTFGDTSFAQGVVVSSDATFGSTTLTRTGITDAFVAKLDGTNGNVVWSKNYGGSGSDTGFGVAATATGVYVTGNTERAGDLNVFAVKLNSSNGNIIWDKNFGGTGEDSGKAIRVDSTGNAYLTGYLKSSTANFDTTVLQSASTNTFALKLNNTDGSVAWAKSLGASGEEYGNGIGLDGSGNVYIAGYFTSATWSLGTTTLTKNDTTSADIFALKLSGTTGDVSWARSFGGNNFDSAYGLAVDSAGNSYITGEFYSTSMTVGNQTLNAVGGSEFFVTKLDNLDPIVPPASPLDLVFYDPTKGQVSFGFVGSGYNINSAALTGDTPVLTENIGGTTPLFSSDWRFVSGRVDVDQDGTKDLIVVRKSDNQVVVFFGDNRTSTTRQYAYTRAAAIPFVPGADWTLAFASNKIGVNDSPGLFWQNKNGTTVIWSLTATTNGSVTSLGILGNLVFNLGADSGWKASGDGEFNSSTATREVFWRNEKTSQMVTWSLTGARSLSSAKLTWTTPLPTSTFNVVGIANVSGNGINDNIIWQTGNAIVVWNMADGAYSPTGTGVVFVTANDTVKVLADVNGDGSLDLVSEGADGSIAAYELTASYALKNTASPRTQYTASNAAYRPAKGGPNNANLELVNVAQYGV